ncbi:hypothetical protein PCANC_07905 [Puccinia coronata f. sp. avenae]|uniref:BED-type domain-containing protein n=1 Tax=Puccinia coronata f. sp. avenae TaxID=200324 RepID=A0A2N5UYH9_9BASI|nr:hypothetical protein PCANC_07905 [Puccinia coronata f. sp. avenae]
MVGRSKRRRKAPASQAPESSESDIAAQSEERPHQKKRPSTTMVSDNSDHNHDKPATNATLSQELSDEQELAKARKVHKNQVSSCYAFYHPPELSNELDKHKRRKMAYSCKQCGTKIHRPSYDTSPSNLSKHVAACSKKQQEAEETQKLAALGVTGTQDVDPREVPQLCAIWCAEGAQPFLALGKRAHQAILHPDVLKNLPNRRAVASDIGRLYTAVQQSLIKTLEVIMRPFGTQKNNKANNDLSQQEGSDNKDNEADADEFTEESNEESENEGNDVNDLSNEEEDDCYTSDSCRQTLAKLCQEKKCLTPHNVERDVTTRWNSALMQLTSIVQCSEAILDWQKDKRHGPSRDHFITQNNLDLVQDLVNLLQPFYKITLQVSMRGAAQISQVVVFIDQITSHL